MNKVSGVYREPRWQIGFYEGPLRIRAEEEEEEDDLPEEMQGGVGRSNMSRGFSPESRDANLDRLIEERSKILDSIKMAELSPREKLALLDDNRQSMIILRGGSPYKFGTEKVIYSILVFSAFLIVVLSLLTAFADLPKEVTMTFVGTVVGGTIATIAQKLGKIGR